MTSLFIYFLKANLALAILYICYRLLFQNDTFFRLRRGTLLSIYLIAFLYQLPDISGWLATRGNVSDVVTYYSSLLLPAETSALTASDENTALTTNWKELLTSGLTYIYITGVFILLFRCLSELFHILRLYYRSKKECINGMKVCILPDTEEAYSFFGWIFVSLKPGSKQALNEILFHEATHVRQMHSLDVLLGEIVAVFCWMNPFAWLLKKEISINHEYLADQEVLYAGYNKKEYQYHLIGMEHPNKAAANLYNNFSVLPLKKRITMLNKKRTHGVRKVKYLALIPMAISLLLLNNIDAMARIVNGQIPVSPTEAGTISIASPVENRVAPLPQDSSQVFTVVEKMPQYPGGHNVLAEILKVKKEDYPVIAIEKGIEGRVSLSFIVEKDGSISNIDILRSIDPSLDKAAVKIVEKMPKWTPGEQRGKKVRVQYTVPVTFKLADIKKEQQK